MAFLPVSSPPPQLSFPRRVRESLGEADEVQAALVELRLQYAQAAPRILPTLGQTLRKTWPGPQAIWLLQQLEMYWDALRLEAFREPLRLWFESQGLQMGSRWPLAERRAREIQSRFPTGLVVEIGAGIGGDSLELARLLALRCCEQHPARLQCLRHNLQDWPDVEVVEGNGLEQVKGASGIFADPARRDSQGRRCWSNLEPDPQEIWKMPLPTCLKLSPGLDESLLPPNCDLDYVSHQGVCKEAVVYTPGRGQIRACLYRQGIWLESPRQEAPRLGPLEPGMWLHEPDPAAIRARIWQPEGAWRVDETLALLASPPGLTSPWTQAFEVLAIEDADRKNLTRLQRHYDFFPLEIKKRGFDIDPEELRKKLPKGQSGGPGVLFLTRLQGRHRALVCRRCRHLSEERNQLDPNQTCSPSRR